MSKTTALIVFAMIFWIPLMIIDPEVGIGVLLLAFLTAWLEI
jgi:hypothetical protein